MVSWPHWLSFWSEQLFLLVLSFVIINHQNDCQLIRAAIAHCSHIFCTIYQNNCSTDQSSYFLFCSLFSLQFIKITASLLRAFIAHFDILSNINSDQRNYLSLCSQFFLLQGWCSSQFHSIVFSVWANWGGQILRLCWPSFCTISKRTFLGVLNVWSLYNDFCDCKQKISWWFLDFRTNSNKFQIVCRALNEWIWNIISVAVAVEKLIIENKKNVTKSILNFRTNLNTF